METYEMFSIVGIYIVGIACVITIYAVSKYAVHLISKINKKFSC